MNLKSLLVNLTPDDHFANGDETLDVLQRAEESGEAVFDCLPPMLTHIDPRPSSYKLYCGTWNSPAARAAYVDGPFADAPRRRPRAYWGAAIYSVNGVAHAATVYTATIDGKTTGVVHAHDAPLAELEADLFDPRRSTGAFERTWLGDIAEHTRTMRVHTGAFMRSCGLASMPMSIINGNFHLARPGIMPLLHLRAPTTTYEEELCCQALTAALAFDPEAEEAEPRSGILESGLEVTTWLTVFDRCKDAYDFVASQLTPERVKTTPAWKPFLKRKTECESVVRNLLISSRLNLYKQIAASVLQRSFDDVAIETSELVESDEMERAGRPATIATLSAMLASCGRVALTHLNKTHAGLEELANAMFERSDAALAWRDTENASESACARMARRVAPPQAIMLVTTDEHFAINNAKLLNATTDETVGSIDEMARLCTMPWVRVVVEQVGVDDDSGYEPFASNPAFRSSALQLCAKHGIPCTFHHAIENDMHGAESGL